MKAITIQQPWAEMIARGTKRVENRTWKTSYRGPLAIHVSSGKSWLNRELPLEWPALYGVEFPSDLEFGAIIAVVDLIDCVPIADLPPELRNAWATGPYCFVLANARRLETSIQCSGKLMIWSTDLI